MRAISRGLILTVILCTASMARAAVGFTALATRGQNNLTTGSDCGLGATTITTSGASLIIVALSGSANTPTFSAVTVGGAAATQRVARTLDYYGTPWRSEIWTYWSSAALSNASVVATLASSGLATCAISVVSATGTDANSAGATNYGENTSAVAASVAVTTTANGSVVFANIQNNNQAGKTAGANSAELHDWIDPNDNGYWTGYNTQATTSGNSYTVAITQAAAFLATGLEVKAAAGATAGKTDAYRNGLVNAFFRTSTYTFPTTLTVRLYSACPTVSTSGTEVAAAGYSGAALNPGTGNWAAAVNGLTSNSVAVSFGTAGANWTVNCVGLESGGTIYAFGAVTGAPVTVVSGETARFPAGALQITEAMYTAP
jgi:hypothetical protein